jgi:RalA-binding protein 1
MSTYQSVITEQESLVQFRALPLLPYDLPYTRINVTNSSIRPNDRGKDVLSFVVLVDPGNQKEPYLVEKLYSDVLGLDQRIRSRYGKSIHKKIPHLPDGKLWRDHAPSRVDQRKAVLEQYVQALINLPVKNNDEVIAFLTSDVIKETNKPVARDGYKEGYLTKRGKNFGGWKTRFFVLQGPQLEYYESRGGQHLGTINITGAQIGRQHRPADRRESDEEGEYRHAFLIIEVKKGTGPSHRHVLCAESDGERDNWVEILVRYVSGAYDEHASPHSSLYVNTSATTSMSSSQPRSSTSSNAPIEIPLPHRDRRQGQRGMVKDEINVSSAVPLSRLAPDPSNAKLFQATPLYDEASGGSSKSLNIASSPEQSGHTFTDAQTARRLLDRGSPSLAQNAESPLSSSLPTTSPLDNAGGDFTPSIGPRANSELGHYPDSDLIEPQGSRGGGRNPQPSPEHPRHRQAQRISLHPALEPLHSSESLPQSDRPASPDGVNQGTPRADMPTKVKISGPMNGTPIPPGHKFGAKEPVTEAVQSDRRDKVKSRMFQWGWRQHGEKPIAPAHANMHRAVFGVMLEESLEVASIGGLPAIVFRCIEYLETTKADQEEGIYRLSGSSAVIKSLKDKFNCEGDVDLLRSDEYWDPHAIAGLLKSFFRDLPSSILTRDLHMRFLSVMDLVDPQERITELSHLIAILPVANYSLLRALTAHLISVVQNSNVNKMTMRNVGIVFSPTLGIPAGVFSLMLAEFNRVFNVNDDAYEAESAAAEKDSTIPSVSDASGTDVNHRNSKHYLDATTDQLLGLSGRQLTGPEEEGGSDDAEELSENTESGADTTDQDTMAESPPGSQSNAQQTQVPQEPISSPRTRASNVAASRGLGIRVESSDGPRQGQVGGLPASPRPLARSPRSTAHPQVGATSGTSAPSQ